MAECATKKPDGANDWNVQFLIDATYLDAGLTADVTSQSDNVAEVLSPDIAPGTKGWNLCYLQTDDESASVQVMYSNGGKARFILDYNLNATSTGFNQGMHVKFQDVDNGYTARFQKPSTASVSN